MHRLLIVDDEELERKGTAQFIPWDLWDELVGNMPGDLLPDGTAAGRCVRRSGTGRRPGLRRHHLRAEVPHRHRLRRSGAVSRLAAGARKMLPFFTA